MWCRTMFWGKRTARNRIRVCTTHRMCQHLDSPTTRTNNTKQRRVTQEYKALPVPSSSKDMLSRTRWRIPQQCCVPRSWPSGAL